MGLSNDQRALLRLLAQREEGYEDIAALMGIGVDEVRARVKEALAELQEETSPAAESHPASPRTAAAKEPTAPPAGPVAAGDPPPAVAEASSEAVPPAAPPAGGAEGQPTQAPAASAAPRRPSAQPRPGRSAKPAASPRQPRLPRPEDRRRLIELVGGALVALLLILFATGAVDLGGGDDSDSDTQPAATSQPISPEDGEPAADAGFTQAILEPRDGGSASGLARFGRVKKSVVLQVEAEGLEPTGAGESYTVWLYRSPKLVLRVGAVRVTESGGIAAQFPIPDQLLGVVANRAFNQIDVSLTADDAYRAELARARQQKRLPTYTGASVLRGEIAGPLVSGE